MWTSVKVKSKNYFSFTDFFAKIKSLLTHVFKNPPLTSHYPTDILNLLCELIWQGSCKLKEPDLCKLKGLVPITTFVARASRWRIKHYIGVFFQKRNSNKTFLRNSLGWFQCVARPDDVFDIDVTWNYKFLFISFRSYEQLLRDICY